ncbi:MAG: hypothetical protein ACJAZX_000685 [Rickettsiales bacterium]|jgi:hypothetical protein
MRSDKFLSAMINFLVPMILLYGFFVLTDYLNNGFFALIYATILLVIAFVIFSAKFSDLKFSSLISIKIISWIGLLIAISYLAIILFLLIDLIPEIKV